MHGQDLQEKALIGIEKLRMSCPREIYKREKPGAAPGQTHEIDLVKRELLSRQAAASQTTTNEQKIENSLMIISPFIFM